jgi:hypothetical protein
MPLKTRLYLVGVLSLGYVCVDHDLVEGMSLISSSAVIMGILKAVAQIGYNPLGDIT